MTAADFSPFTISPDNVCKMKYKFLHLVSVTDLRVMLYLRTLNEGFLLTLF